MELKQYTSLIWRWAWLLVIGTVLAAGVSYYTTSRMPKIYRATTTLMVGQATETANPSTQDFANSSALAQTYVQLIRRQPMLEATVNELELNVPWQTLLGAVNASNPPQTQLIQIAVVSSNPPAAQAIADELAHQLILQSPTPDERERTQRKAFVDRQLADLQSQINTAQDDIDRLEKRLLVENSARGVQDVQSQISGLRQKIASWQGTYTSLLGSVKGGTANQITVVEPAVILPTPVSPNLMLNVSVAAGIGFLLAFVAMLVLEYLDDRLKTRDEVARIL